MTGVPTALGGAVVGRSRRLGRRIALAVLVAASTAACAESGTTVTSISGAVASLTITVEGEGPGGTPAAGGPLAMDVGEIVELSATGTNTLGLAVSGVAVMWSSSAPSVVAVDASGVAEALSAGEANVYAAAEGVEATIQVVVTDATTVPPSP